MGDLMPGLAALGRFRDVVREVGVSAEIPAERDMVASLIPAAWLISGQPVTWSEFLGKTQDHLAYAMLWQCGAASFKWHYDKDEFLIILSGDAYATDESGVECRYGPSDVVFFPSGSVVTWRVPDHLRKVAILKRHVSQPLSFVVRAWTRVFGRSGVAAL